MYLNCTIVTSYTSPLHFCSDKPRAAHGTQEKVEECECDWTMSFKWYDRELALQCMATMLYFPQLL